MSDKNVQNQIDEMNQKLDLVLEYVKSQRLQGEMVEDLVQDLSIVGKDAFQSTVDELDRQGVEIDGDEIRILLVKIIRNLNNISQVFSTFESILDLLKDMGPIAKDATIEMIYRLNEMEQKGYFEFLRAVGKVVDKVIAHYTKEDVEQLADNVVLILDTVRSLTQPDMLQAMNNAVNIFKELDPTDVPEYSLWKAMRELNSPEMRKGLGFVITFMKGLATQEQKQLSN